MKKKLIIVICIVLVLLIISGIQTAYADDNDYDIVRVKISIGTPSEFSFFLDGNYSVNGVGLVRQLYTIKQESGGLSLYYGSTLICRGSSIRLVQHTPTSGYNNFIWMHNTRYDDDYNYTGDMEFIFDSNNACIMAVNHVYIEDYLYGVVPYEMSDSWPIEALKAQAVAARNYVISKMGSSGAYDVDDTSSNQVYKGYDASLENTIAAVNATAKQAVSYGGSVVCTYFSASNGGWTDLPLHAWSGGTDVPYYQIQEDTFDTANPSSLYETVFFPAVIDADHPITTSDNVTGTPNVANAVAYIKQAIVESGQLAGVGVDSADDFELTGVTSLIAHTPDTDGVYNDRETVYSDIQCVDYVGATGSFSVSVGGTPETAEGVELDLRYFNGSNGDDTYKVFNNSSLRLFVIKEEASGYSISQKRFGHGIGLSQRGAQQRANSGQSYQEILQFYYPGTSLATQTYSAPVLTSITVSDHSNAFVELTDSTPLNVRSGPGTSYSILGNLPDGARINVVQENAATANGYVWHKILYGGQYAYVAATYVQIDTSVEYQSHVQNIGWQDWVSDGELSGTSGQSLRLEAVRIELNGVDGGIEYKTHVQDIGWMDWVSGGELSGTTGQGKRLEAIQIQLTGAAESAYDIYYRVHVQNFGWMGWAKNGESAGSAGFAYRMEAIEIVLVEKGGAAPGSTGTPFVDKNNTTTVTYQTHIQDIGWQDWASEGELSGTTGQAKRLEAIRISTDGMSDCIEYCTHVQSIGWMDWVDDGELSGTTGQAKRMEAIRIRLTGVLAYQYDIYYRVHVQNFGWMGWAKNGESAGSAGFAYRMEAIEIVLVKKGGTAPGSTSNVFVQK
ncbi:MAG: SpoIID/LytB domain-containing protein [Eubacteriales bacterium]|nr:SpoIID/LytB domain-containing protein [Eubacteriales bacterium]